MRALYAGILSLTFTATMHAQQSLDAKLVAFHDATDSNCSYNHASSLCATRIYTLEIGQTFYDVQPSQWSAIGSNSPAFSGPLHDQPIGSDWQVTMDGKKYIRVIDPKKKGKGYRFVIVGEHSQS